LVIWFGVDVERGRRDAVLWAEEKRAGANAGGVENASGVGNLEGLGLGLRERRSGGRDSEDKEDLTKDA
jgi:hypothetical protein